MPDPLTLLGFVFILGALIFIHESGHYMVAKALGIKVEVFSLGFGPKLLAFEKGGTEYRVSLLPLGGYVKMLGENPDEALRGSREEFLSRSKFERFLVLVMGATLNIVLAVVLTAGLNMHGVPEPLYQSQSPVIGALDPNAAAAEAGLRVNDEILAVEGVEVSTWRDMQLQVALNPDKRVQFRIRREGQTLDVPVSVRATKRDRIGEIGIEPRFPIVVRQVRAGSAAEQAGVMPGDTVVKLNGQELLGPSGMETFLRDIAANPGVPFTFTLSRDGKLVDLAVTPAEVKEDGKSRGQVGVDLASPVGMRKYGFTGALVESVKWNWEQAGVLFLTLRKLVTLQLSPRTLSGPIDIYRLTGESIRGGWVYYLTFMTVVSLQLGIINLLPIPILDGGHIFILFVEGLIRRDLSMRIKERVMQFGFILLLLIMGGVIYLDVYKNFFIQ